MSAARTSWLDGAKGVASIPLHTTFKGSLVIVVIFLTATALLMNSKHGRSMLAVREDELAAQMSGINTFRSKMHRHVHVRALRRHRQAA